jgi:hypothetical protein
MRETVRFVVLVGVLLIYLLAGASATYSGSLRTSTWNAIKISYMNGYVQALKMDSEELAKLKSDEALLRQTVIEKATKYMQVVESMNR